MSEPIESSAAGDTAANNRLMLNVVIGLGVVIVIVIGVMIYGITAGWGKHAAPAAAAAKKPVSMSLAPGYRILSSDTQPGRLILHVRSDTVDEIDIIDLNDGRIISQIHADAPK
ncbi:hypothetical protein FHS83_002250 [Rhizomicrobium palustre]|uniref:Uncharacterized protein n=1 Tax=Rhizomicrobium palustre TaxID=189966 RepID=A0A846N119_9PROT|nr:hypothetical protein [Rhizomicrobium palustre]NIK88932.1 hypothetical protein [Rhizomicrobium palustre]